MVEVFVLDQDRQTRIRLDAARIYALRRQTTRFNALRDLDKTVIQEATAAGHRRGTALSIADSFMDAITARLTELERQNGECTVARNVTPIRRQGAVA